jgi:chemotaxis protein methyltransferase CheR
MELDGFKQLLVQHAGLAMTHNDDDKVLAFLRTRLAELNLGALPNYLNLLTADNLATDQEWQHVVQALTVPESFFLRDKGQMHILHTHILPELIQRNQNRRQLRVWSAGCSTGEEPYSLAFLIQKLLPIDQDWEILILGTDINDKVLAKARDGLYSRWSLRDTEPEILGYFQPAAQGLLLLDASIRNKVVFRRVNLLQTPFPDLEINNIDLILCRNVFIYFDQQAIATVLEKFIKTLNPGGYLMTGHGELYQQPLNGLQTQLFLESVVYQRDYHKTADPCPAPSYAVTPLASKPTAPSVLPPDAEETPARHIAEELRATYQRGDYEGVVALAQQHLLPVADFAAYYWSAKAYASLGHYHTAQNRLKTALELNPASAHCHYLLAQIKELQDDTEQSKALLNKVITLDETYIPAYLELSQLYEQEDPLQCQAMREQALRLLNQLPPDHYLEELDVSASDLIQQLL